MSQKFPSVAQETKAFRTESSSSSAFIESSQSHSTALQDLARRLYCPEPKVKQIAIATNPESSTLSYIPWQLQYHQRTESSVADDDDDDSAQPNTNKVAASSTLSFLPVSYLDLRRQQNVAFADQKCQEAISCSLSDRKKALSLFQQALELVPDHVDTLLGYGKMLFQMGRLEPARRAFDDILQVDPNHESAQRYLKSLEQTQRHHRQKQQLQLEQPNAAALLSSTKKNKVLTVRDSSAFQDALLERNLAMGDDAVKEFTEQQQDPSDDDDDDDDDSSRSSYRRSRKRKDRSHHHHHHKKRKKKDKKKKRSRKKGKRQHKRSSRSSYSSASSVSS